MESGAELLAPQDKSTARYAKDRTTTKKQRNSLCKEDDWTSLKKTLVNSHYPAVRDSVMKLVWSYSLIQFLNKQYSMFYRGLEGSGSHMIIPSL